MHFLFLILDTLISTLLEIIIHLEESR